MLLFSLINLRKIINPTGYHFNLPILNSEDNITSFLNSNEYSFILFESSTFVLSWMDYGIFKYEDKIAFAQAPISFAKKYGCESQYCFFAFHKQEPIEAPDWALYFPVQFANWLGQISHPNSFNIETSATLRAFISQIEENCIFGIDQNSTNIPSFIPKDEFIAFSTSTAFEQYKITDLKPGWYYYRYSDRQLLPYESRSETSPFVTFTQANTSAKPYIAAFVYEKDQIPAMQEGLNVMNQLAANPQYSENIDFIFNEVDQLRNLTKDASLYKASPPYFAFIHKSNFSYRWIAQEGDEKNLSYIEELIKIGMENQTEPTFSCEKPYPILANETFHRISSCQFKELVLDPNYDTVLSATASWCGHCKNYKPVAMMTSKALKDQPIKFYWIEGTRNAFPDEVPHIEGYPSIFLFPMKNKSNPSKIHSYSTMQALLDSLNSFNLSQVYYFPDDFDQKAANQTIKLLRR